MNDLRKVRPGWRYGWKTCFALMLLLAAAALYLLVPYHSVLLWVLAGALLAACPVLHYLVHRKLGHDLSREQYEALSHRGPAQARTRDSVGQPGGRPTTL